MTAVDTCVKNRGPLVAFRSTPNTFYFKEERVLANHPPSCHPQRMFDAQKMKKKMKESEIKEKKREN